MKVGTDSVLLGCWAGGERTFNRILDVGTGTGILALLVAQRMPTARITALEKDVDATLQAKKNVSLSPWKDRIHVLHGDFRTFKDPKAFDFILSNPPYFQDALLSPDPKRNLARHTVSLPYRDLLCRSASLLSEGGMFSLIVPAEQAPEIRSIAFEYGLYTSRQAAIKTHNKGSVKRVMMEFSDHLQICRTEEITIHAIGGGYSSQFLELTQDVYLKNHSVRP